MKRKSPTDSGPKRLQKVLSERGVSSRRAAEILIKEGRVRVDGKTVTELGTRVDPDAKIQVDGKSVEPQKKRLFLFHKPRGVLTTLSDPQGRKDLTHFTNKIAERVFPIGRLDRDVSGLLLLTNDGDFAEQLLHPRYEEERVYLALVKGSPDEKTLQRAKRGIRLEDGQAKAKRIDVIREDRQSRLLLGESKGDSAIVRLVVNEGRNHFVKRFLAALGHPVLRLSRIEFGGYKLGELAPGKFREITTTSRHHRNN